MTHSNLRRSAALALPLLGLVAGGTTSTANAQPAPPKPPPVVKACAVSAIPLVVGNEWTYEPVSPPPENELTDQQKKLTPVRPDKIVVKVTAIDTKNGVTTVTLNELIDGKPHDTTITCNQGGSKFQVAMDSFWFAGEPGTVTGIELSNLERKGTTLSLVGGKISQGIADWRDDIKASWKHLPTSKTPPTMRNGTVSIERHWVLQPDASVASKWQTWPRVQKLGLETVVNVVLDPPLVPAPPPEPPPAPPPAPAAPGAPPAPPPAPPAPPPPVGRFPLQGTLVNFIWIADGFGPVQVLNSYGQMFQLTSANLQPPPPPPK